MFSSKKGQLDNLCTFYNPPLPHWTFFLPNYMALTFSLLSIFQLYELDGDPKRKEFLDDLFNFMQKRGKLGKLHTCTSMNDVLMVMWIVKSMSGIMIRDVLVCFKWTSGGPVGGFTGWLIVLLPASRQPSEWPLVKMSWIKTYFKGTSKASIKHMHNKCPVKFYGRLPRIGARPPIYTKLIDTYWMAQQVRSSSGFESFQRKWF